MLSTTSVGEKTTLLSFRPDLAYPDAQVGLRQPLVVVLYLDHEKNVSFGFTKGYLYSFSPFGSPGWTSNTADMTITFGNGPYKLAAKGMKKLFGYGRRPRRTSVSSLSALK